jgi:soluble P-type ATPase
MIEISIPGHGLLRLRYLVLDFNGTIAVDGDLIPGVKDALRTLAKDLEIHVVTADTFGSVRSRLKGLPCSVSILPGENQDAAKLEYVKGLGPGSTVCMGNGRNDRLMLKEAALGIALILDEGAAAETVLSADLFCTDIVSALGLLTHPLRLTATLRS